MIRTAIAVLALAASIAALAHPAADELTFAEHAQFWPGDPA